MLDGGIRLALGEPGAGLAEASQAGKQPGGQPGQTTRVKPGGPGEQQEEVAQGMVGAAQDVAAAGLPALRRAQMPLGYIAHVDEVEAAWWSHEKPALPKTQTQAPHNRALVILRADQISGIDYDDVLTTRGSGERDLLGC